MKLRTLIALGIGLAMAVMITVIVSTSARQTTPDDSPSHSTQTTAAARLPATPAATPATPPPVPASSIPSPTRTVWSCASLGLVRVSPQTYPYLGFGGTKGFKHPAGEVCEDNGKVLPTGMDSCISRRNMVMWPECTPPIWLCSSETSSERIRPCYPYTRYRDDRTAGG